MVEDAIYISEKIKNVTYKGAYLISSFIFISLLITSLNYLRLSGVYTQSAFGYLIAFLLLIPFSYFCVARERYRFIVYNFLVSIFYLPVIIIFLAFLYLLIDMSYSGKFLDGHRLTSYIDSLSTLNIQSFMTIWAMSLFIFLFSTAFRYLKNKRQQAIMSQYLSN